MYEARDDEREEGAAAHARDDDKDLFKKLRREFALDADHWRPWFRQAEEDFAFYAGDHYSKDDLAEMEAKKRPAVAFNRVQPTINVICGHEVSNRQEITYYAREMGDVSVSEVVTSACKWFRETSDAEDEESDAFRDTTICGIGWVENRLDYDAAPDGKPACDRIDPMEMFVDRYSRKPNFVDARRQWRVRKISLADAKDMFPDADEKDLNASWADAYLTGKAGIEGDPSEDYWEGDEGESEDDTNEITLVECQFAEREPYWRVTDPGTGQPQEMDDATYKKFTDRLKKLGFPLEMLQAVRQSKLVRRKAFIGRVILEVGPTACPSHFSYQAITGLRDQKAGTWFGLVRPMKDPQKWANKFLSQILHIVNTTAKGGVMVEEGATDDMRAFENSWAQTDAVTKVSPGALSGGKVQPKPATPYPQGFDRLMDLSFTAIRDSTGVNNEMLGLRDANQPGVLEYQRKQAGMTIIATFFDSLRRYRKAAGEIILYFIQNDLSDGRIIRIVGEEKEVNWPLLRDQTLGDYDIIVDEAPSAPNVKDRNWSLIQPMLEMMPPPVQMAALKYSPLSEAAQRDLMKAAQEAMANQPPDPAVQKAEADMQVMQAKTQADITIAQQKAQADERKAQVELAMKAKEHELKMAELTAKLQAQREELAMDRERMELEREQGLETHFLEQEREAERFEMEKQKHRLAGEEQGKALEPRFQGFEKALAALQEQTSRKRRRTVNVKRDPQTNRMLSAEVIDE